VGDTLDRLTAEDWRPPTPLVEPRKLVVAGCVPYRGGVYRVGAPPPPARPGSSLPFRTKFMLEVLGSLHQKHPKEMSQVSL
jgi:hypothetical protein